MPTDLRRVTNALAFPKMPIKCVVDVVILRNSSINRLRYEDSNLDSFHSSEDIVRQISGYVCVVEHPVRIFENTYLNDLKNYKSLALYRRQTKLGLT